RRCSPSRCSSSLAASSLASAGCTPGSRTPSPGGRALRSRARRMFLAQRVATSPSLLFLIGRVVVRRFLFIGVLVLGLGLRGNATIRGGNRFIGGEEEIPLAAHLREA